MGSAGAQVMSGYNSMTSPKQKVNFTGFIDELEAEISETRKELNFCKKEVQILNTEKDTVAEMAETKCEDINRYLNKEIHYLEELVSKSQVK
mgnify:CR=1 FL=1